VPFHGEHQAGIVTPAQDRLHFVAFDVTTKDRDELVELLKDWTAPPPG
jgi:deferrochelatase/peroxidase EfeB